METPAIASRFGILVKQSRKKLHLSQAELAARAGLHRTYLSDIERGRRNVSLRNIEKLADAFQIPVVQFFSQMEPPNPGPVRAVVPPSVAGLIPVKPEIPTPQARSRV